ncbi:ATP-dependent RNA helicase dbp7 [Blyttiomyces sp. JEL0837]|nr:ATP-dependent RNA helicase dbp7 [Blyttiomyces sp. JEL0837]
MADDDGLQLNFNFGSGEGEGSTDRGNASGIRVKNFLPDKGSWKKKRIQSKIRMHKTLKANGIQVTKPDPKTSQSTTSSSEPSGSGGGAKGPAGPRSGNSKPGAGGSKPGPPGGPGKATAKSGGTKHVVSSLFTANPEVSMPAPSLTSSTADGKALAEDLEKQKPRTPTNAVPTGAAALAAETFAELALDPVLVAHLRDKMSVKTPTNIQRKSMAALLPLNSGDTCLQAQTGSGKTLAYLLPIVQRLMFAESERGGALSKSLNRELGTIAIVLAPTRELAKQISTVLEALLRYNSSGGGSGNKAVKVEGDDDDDDNDDGDEVQEKDKPKAGTNGGDTAPKSKHRHWIIPGLVVGGDKKKSEKARLRKGSTILVSTPGRLLDHMKTTRAFEIGNLRWLILDEADRLTDLGFENTLKEILHIIDDRRNTAITTKRRLNVSSWPAKRQIVLTSATLQDGIRKLAETNLENPVFIREDMAPKVVEKKVDKKVEKKEEKKATETAAASAGAAAAVSEKEKKKAAAKSNLKSIVDAVLSKEAGNEPEEGDMSRLPLKDMEEEDDSDLDFWDQHQKRPKMTSSATCNEELLDNDMDVIEDGGDDMDIDIAELGEDEQPETETATTEADLIYMIAKNYADADHETSADTFNVPQQLRQIYTLVPAKLRLVSLVGILRQSASRKSDKFKIIIFTDTCDSVDFLFHLLANAHKAPTRDGVRQDDGKDDDERGDGDGEDMDQEDAKAMKKKKYIAKAKSKKAGPLAPPENSALDRLGLESPFYPSTGLFKLHGNLAQSVRTVAYEGFTKAERAVLICTDVAARGLDLPDVTHVIQYDMPPDSRDYVHRIGRTARLGRDGLAVSMLLPSEVDYVKLLEDKGMSLTQEDCNKYLQFLIDCPVPDTPAPANAKAQPLGKKKKKKSVEDAATDVQMMFERFIHGDSQNIELARAAFRSHVRAYATHTASERQIFHIKKLHLGHLAKSFGLREAPSMGKASGAAAAAKVVEARKDKEQRHAGLRGAPASDFKPKQTNISLKRRANMLMSRSSAANEFGDGGAGTTQGGHRKKFKFH